MNRLLARCLGRTVTARRAPATLANPVVRERMAQQAESGQRTARGATGGGLAVHVHDLTVSFPSPDGRLTALQDCSLDVAAGSFTVIIGPNGSGKSTLLRAIAGLLLPERGRVTIGPGPDAEEPGAGDPRVGIAFQQPRLLPWLTVAENVELPLAVAGIERSERAQRTAAALKQVGLADAARLRPAELSGGMAQRAGLARALVSDPPVLLLDEPFSALDALTREAFDTELQHLWLEQRRTLILVTHSVGEAVRLADEVMVLSARPGSVARLVPVDLPRPRAVDVAAVEQEAAIRAALASVHPPELARWTSTR
ncbi:MAG TPA: ABC transporter ATP-binding protein [Candidatus Limnocylindria bacterium]